MTKVGKNSGYQEIHGRLGFFGWIWRILLAVWQVVVIGWLVNYITAVDEMVQIGGAKGAGAVIGGSIGIGLIIAVWIGGSIILGIFVLLTRRAKAIVPVQESG